MADETTKLTLMGVALRARRLLSALIAATATFEFGVAAERRSEEDHGETSDAYVEGALAAGDDGAASPAGGEGATHEDDEAPLEVNLESTPLVIASVVVSIALAALVGLRSYTRVLWVVVVFAGVLAVLDGAELMHQMRENGVGVAVIAAVVAVLHAATALIAEARATTRTTP